MSRLFLPNLRARLVAVILLALLPAFVLLISISALERDRAEESARLESMALAQLLKTQYEGTISNMHQSLQWLSDYPELTGGDRAACDARLQRFQSVTDDLLTLSVFDARGAVLCDTSDRPAADWRTVTDQLFFRRALETGTFAVGDLQVDAVSGRRYLTVGYPILDESGEVQAVIGAGLDAVRLGQRLTNTQFYQHAALLLIDRAGAVILRYPDPERFVGQDATDLELFRQVQATGEGWAEAPGLTGARRIFGFTPIGPAHAPDLYALAGLSEEYVYAGARRMLRLSLTGLTVIGLVALLAAWLSAELMIVRRTKRVVHAAERMAAGDLSARAGLQGDFSEVGQLAQAFDTMAASLQERDTENARLIAEMQQLNAGLEARVVKRTEQLLVSNTRLVASQSELRRLSEELMRITEQERTRISREIHDQLGQLLTAVKMELRAIDRALARDPQVASEHIRETSGLVDETIRTVRRISADLRPGILDDFGLAAAIEWQTEQFKKRTGMELALEAEIVEESLSKDMATAAFRILQEALTNVARHSEATSVNVAVRTTDAELLLTIGDNGKGLHPDPNHRSFGVVGMRERARQFGGSVTISDNPGGGALVHLRMPLHQYDVTPPPQVN